MFWNRNAKFESHRTSKPQTRFVFRLHSDLLGTLVQVCSILKPRTSAVWVLHLFVSRFSWTHCLANTFQPKHEQENLSFSIPLPLSLSPSLFVLPSLSFPSFHLIKAHGLSPLFTKYSLTKKKWEFLLIEDQSGKVSSSNPALSIRAP